MIAARHFLSGFILPLALLIHSSTWTQSRAFETDYLPDAAAHLGTIVINQDDQYTDNPLVSLRINAVDNGSGLTQMQFSEDDQTWSAPEAYSTNRQWQLTVAPNDYPPQMNTVLKTIYVRVQYGDGTWSRAFSDGIVFAKSAQDVPLVKEVWIMQQRPASYNPAQPSGSAENPYIVAAGANEAAFDTLMNTLKQTYSSYTARPGPGQTNPPAVNNVSVLYLHLGAGTYQTHGDNGGRGGSLAWGPSSGERIQGAGKDSTVLTLVGGNSNGFARVIGNLGNGMGLYDNLEISDLTADANMHEGGNTTSPWLRTGVTLAGNNIQLRRLRVKGFGSRIAGLEPGGMSGYNAATGDLYDFHIEDCEVVAPQSQNLYEPLMIGYEAGTPANQTNLYWMYNVVIRNNYVNGLMYDQKTLLNPYTNTFLERGSHGIVLGGCTNSIVEDNFVVHVMSGYYNDTFDINNVLVRNNHFRDVIAGLNFGDGIYKNIIFSGNFVELDPHYYTAAAIGGTGPSDYGWRTAVLLSETLPIPIHQAFVISNTCQFTDQVPPTPPLTGVFSRTYMSGSVDFENNAVIGFSRAPIQWYQWEGLPLTYLDQQVDILDPTQPPPVITANNRHEDGTIIEVFPYVLDRTLPRPVVTPGQAITFPAPRINGNLPGMVTGLPITNLLDANGNFNWTPTQNDIGRYVVSFYDSALRTQDPRRTLIKVQSPLSDQDARFFQLGLKAYWKLGEIWGNLFLDSSGNSHPIVIPTTAATYLERGVPGRRPGQTALRFDNSNPMKSATLVLPNSQSQFFGGFPLAYHPMLERSTVLLRPFTLSYWFNPSHQPANNEVILNYAYQMICGVGPGTNLPSQFATVYCFYPNSPDLTAYLSRHPQTINVTVGAWHHFALVYDGVTTALYVDGGLQTTIPCGQLEDFNNGSPIFLGGLGGDNYLGILSDLAIWNRPLTASEITTLYADQLGTPNSPNLSPPSNVGVQAW